MGSMHNSANIATLEYIILGALALLFFILLLSPSQTPKKKSNGSSKGIAWKIEGDFKQF